MRAKALINKLFWGNSAAERRWGVALVVVFFGLAIFLRLAGSEWREAVSERLAKTEKRYEREGRQFETEDARQHALFKSVKLEQWVQAGLYWAALANLLFAGVLLVTRRWWCEAGAGAIASGVPPPATARFWMVVGGAVLLATVLRLPRMDFSLYNDEAYNFRHYIHGQFKQSSDGKETFDQVSWFETFWKNKANNGVPFSALARLGDGVWRSSTGAENGEIGEASLRWAALVPGLLSIVVVAALGRRLAGGLAGGAAAFWLAVHPWHVRYCTEARPYGLVLLFAALAMFCLYEALQRDRWRWWLGFAASQFLLVWAFAGAVYFAAGLNVAALGFCMMRGAIGRKVGARLVASSVLSAMLYLQLMAPCFPQMLHTLSTVESFSGVVGGALVVDASSYLAVGMPARDEDPTNPSNPALAKYLPYGWPLLLAAVAGILALIVCAIKSARGAREWRFIAGGNVLAMIFALAMSAYSGSVLHIWYLIYLLPCAALVLAAGWAWSWGRGGRWRWAGVLAVVVLLALSARPLRDYLGHGKESLREIAAKASEGGALVGGFWTDAKIYAREMRVVKGVGDLKALVGEARAAGRPLSVVFGHRELAALIMPECVRLLEGDDFERVGVFPGLEEAQFTTQVYRLKSGGTE